MSENHRQLLKDVALLYEKHEAGRTQPFNVFSVLRSENDEVNLHSRFLHALLDYRRPHHEARDNLADFLRHVGVGNFEQRGVEVKREQDYIDIQITNGDKQAVVIENKIWAGDQPEQLQRYHDAMRNRGYDQIRVLYLTLHGDDPSEDSAGDLPYETISYKDTLPPWLERCQQRAYDEPGLRESVAQYRHLIRKLTGTDLEETYMNALTELCLKSNNLLLVYDLKNEPYVEAVIHLLQKLWCEIDAALQEEFPPLAKNEELSNISSRAIREFVKNRSRYKWKVGLFYSFGRGAKSASLAVQAGDELCFGVYCDKPLRRGQLTRRLQNVNDGQSDSENHWPWFKHYEGVNLKVPTRENLELLSNGDSRKKYAQGIAQGLEPVWDKIKKAGLVGRNP